VWNENDDIDAVAGGGELPHKITNETTSLPAFQPEKLFVLIAGLPVNSIFPFE
jgi:hypothetical protein